MKKITLFISLLFVMIGNSQNLITNGDFSNGATGWALSGPGSVVAGEMFFTSTNDAGNPWDTQLVKGSLVLPAGTPYTLSFKARAVAPRNLKVSIQNTGSWEVHTEQTVALTTTMQTFTYNFASISVGNVGNIQLSFLMGMLGSTQGVYFDDVSLSAVTTPPSLPLIQNFEAPITYASVAAFGGTTVSVVADPVSGGTNGQVFRGVQGAGQVWQGIEFVQTAKKAKLTTNKTMQVDVYATQAFNILAKVENGGPASANGQAYTTPGVWQTLTFNFAVPMDGQQVANGEYTKIIFFGNWNATNTGFNASPIVGFTFHVDNIRAEETAIVPEPVPTVAAPTPPARPVADVKSIFSNAYTPIVASLNYAGVDGQPSNDNTFNTSWCSGTTTLIQVAGNDTNKITGLGCEGIAFISGRFDASSFTHFHIDMWTPTATLNKSFNIKFSNWNGGTQETNAFEYSITNANILTNPNPGTWYSFDIPFSSFSCVGPAGNPCPSRSDFTQFIITSDLGTVYYDNLYLHKNTLSNSEFTKNTVSIYPNPVQDILTINSLETVKSISIFNINGQQMTARLNNNTIDTASYSNGVYLLNVELANGSKEIIKFVK